MGIAICLPRDQYECTNTQFIDFFLCRVCEPMKADKAWPYESSRSPNLCTGGGSWITAKYNSPRSAPRPA